jgi:ubiquinone/menaquinone biosynthesis C-methylase UbiE
MKMTPDILERLRAFRARDLEFSRLGYDRAAAARFVVAAGGALSGPALDVGTGKGVLATELARRGLEVVSVDVDLEEQELAGLLAQETGVGDRISFVLGDAARLECPDGKFGCAAMMDVLHHLEEPVEVLREMARLVADKGTIIVADFDEQGFELVARVHREEGREHPRTKATVDVAEDVLCKSGFRCLKRTNGHFHEVAVLTKGDNHD